MEIIVPTTRNSPPNSSFQRDKAQATEDAKFRCRNKSKSVPVSPSYKQRDVEAGGGQTATTTTLTKTKSIANTLDEGDGLRKGLLGTASSSKSLFGGNSNSSDGKPRIVVDEADLDLLPDAPMVDVVKAIIILSRVENAVWTEGNSHKKWQVSCHPSPFSIPLRWWSTLILKFK